MTRRAAWLCGLLALPGCGHATSDPSSPVRLAFGRTGQAPLEFAYPRACVSLGREGLAIVDKSGRIQVADWTGNYVREWSMPEIAAGKPTGLGVDRAGRVYAADTHYSRVMVFDAQGSRLSAFGSYGDGPGQFRMTTDVAVDASGRVYVGEYGGNDRISVFSPDHEFLFSFDGADGGGARLSRPQSLLLDGDSLWVADACNHRLCRFSLDGRLLATFGTLGGGPGQLRFPYGVDRLSDGTLVVCEYGNNRVQRFTTEGRSLGVWGRAGRRPGELAYPWALAVGPGDRVYVVDSGNNRVQAFDGLASSSWRH